MCSEHPPRVAGPQIAVAGTGSIGMRHLRTLRDALGLVPVAIPARESRIPQLEADGFRTAASLAHMPGGQVATIVATDTARHLADAMASLPRGPVLIEKPLAPTTSGLAAVDAAIRASGHSAHVAFPFRFDLGLLALRSRLSHLGRIDSVRIECQSYLPDWRPDTDYRTSYSARAADGGVLRDLSHELDYAVWLFGRPARVFATLSDGERLGIASDEAADLMWTVPGGPVVTLRLDYVTRAPRRMMRVTAENGEAVWDGLRDTLTIKSVDGAPFDGPAGGSRDQRMRDQAEAFLRVAAGGAGDTLATFEQAAFIVALSDAARRSSRSGAAEPIADWRMDH